MLIILALLFYCFIISLSFKQNSKLAAFLIFAGCVFVMGYRSVDYTADNVAYAGFFINESKRTLAQSWKSVIAQDTKDPFFYFVGNVLSKLGFTYRGYFVLIAAVFMGGYSYLMQKYSKDYFMSVLFLFALNYGYFSMTGLRQALALGLCFFAFDMAIRKKPIPFIILVFFAYLFHSSALIFLLFYPLRNLRITYKQGIAVAIAGFLALAFPRVINSVVEFFAWNDDLMAYSDRTTGLTISGFIIQLAILTFCGIYLAHDSNNSLRNISRIEPSPEFIAQKPMYEPYMNIMFLGLIIQAFAVNIDNIFRMSMYFAIFAGLAITNAVEVQEGENKTAFKLAVVGLLIIQLFRTSSYDHFTMFGGF